MINQSEINLATVLSILLFLALVIFHFNDNLFFGSSEDPVIKSEEAQQDDFAPDLMEQSDY